jgi:hypothetical protein
LSFGLSFLEASFYHHEFYGLFPKLVISLTSLLLTVWISEKLNLHSKLSNVTSRPFSRQEILHIVLTEIVIGNLVCYGVVGLITVFTGSGASCLNCLSIYLLVFSVYHNGEFMFVLWCHP